MAHGAQDGAARDPYDYFALRLDGDTRRRIADFWAHFAGHAEELDAVFSSGQGDRLGRSLEIMEALRRVSPDLMWEFGPSQIGHRLVITAEWNHDLIPLARAVCRAAPSFERFQIGGVRHGDPDRDNFKRNFEARFRRPLTIEGISCAPGFAGLIEYRLTGRGSVDDLEEQGDCLLSMIMGEQCERDWAGLPSAERCGSGLLGRLKGRGPVIAPDAVVQAFTAAIEQAEAALPGRPLSQIPLDTREMGLMQVSNLPEDHPRADLIVYATPSERFAEAVLRPGLFSSRAQSRFGEWFCALRIERTPEHPFNQPDDRYALEEVLHEALAPPGLGGVAGGGHGQEAVYIDLALSDIEAGLSALARAVGAQGLAKAAELRFLDKGVNERPIRIGELTAGQIS